MISGAFAEKKERSGGWGGGGARERRKRLSFFPSPYFPFFTHAPTFSVNDLCGKACFAGLSGLFLDTHFLSGGGGVLQISCNRDDWRMCLGLKFSILGFFWVFKTIWRLVTIPRYPGCVVLRIYFYGLEIWHGIFLGKISVQGFFGVLFDALGIFFIRSSPSLEILSTSPWASCHHGKFC